MVPRKHWKFVYRLTQMIAGETRHCSELFGTIQLTIFYFMTAVVKFNLFLHYEPALPSLKQTGIYMSGPQAATLPYREPIKVL